MADKTFEENMTRLEEIVTRLEKGDVPLSQSLSLFEEGLPFYRLLLKIRPLFLRPVEPRKIPVP